MSIRISRFATGLLVVAVLAVLAGRASAIYYGLGPSKDEWGLKYDVQVTDAGDDKVNIVFTLADEGRLKPFHSLELIAFSKVTDNEGRRSYDMQIPIELKPTADGKRAAQVQMRKEFLDRAHFRVLTHMVDGQRQPSGGAYYNIQVKKFLNNGPAQGAPIASPPAKKVTK
jgi:hypothetical protein